MSFSNLGLSPKVESAVIAAGFETPTPIQAQAIPVAVTGRDVLGIAQTGTGKTASFVLPMLTRLERGRARARMPRTLILEPTRELAAQVADAFELLGKSHRLTVALRRALRASTAPGGASVVNLASMSALRAVPMVPGYSAAKAGIITVTRLLAVKWAKDGIRVNAVAPGAIDTPMTAPMHAAPAIVDAEVAHVPLGRFGTVDEIAPTIAFLCTEHSSYTSGAVFVVDGASDCI